MTDVTWINGRVLHRDQHPTVSAFDAGLVHGVGLFETMLAVGQRVIDLPQHLDRLAHSANTLQLTERINTDALAHAVSQVAEQAAQRPDHTNPNANPDPDPPRTRLRLTITGGDLNLLAQPQHRDEPTNAATPQAGHPTIIIHATRAADYPDQLFQRGARARIADAKANPLNPFEAHKTLNYWWRLRELQIAAQAGAAEALVLQVTNHIAGGTVSNAFVVKDNTLLTPIARGEEQPNAVPSPVLPGITRQRLLHLAQQLGIDTHTRMLSVADALDADELFLSNSSWGVLPITTLERETIGSGDPGPVTATLRNAWLRHIAEHDTTSR